ncbi:hypothetical protein SP41_25 [Salmonella phage 41]|nr:hypothetical protein SP41_25 [Salmonella phage 41]
MTSETFHRTRTAKDVPNKENRIEPRLCPGSLSQKAGFADLLSNHRRPTPR